MIIYSSSLIIQVGGVDLTVKDLWNKYLESIGEDFKSTEKTFESWHFCNNEKDADELAVLTKNGIKQATAALLKSYQVENEPLPKVDELHIIEDWNGNGICVNKVKNVEILPFNEVTEAHAEIEGEGDGSLNYWREEHLKFFKQDAEGLGFAFTEDLDIVFMIFETVFCS